MLFIAETSDGLRFWLMGGRGRRSIVVDTPVTRILDLDIVAPTPYTAETPTEAGDLVRRHYGDRGLLSINY